MIVEKASAVAMYGGSGGAIVFGLTPGEWSVVGVIAGIVVAVIGLAINVIYKHAHYKLAKAKGVSSED
jgi:hypothetical protein